MLQRPAWLEAKLFDERPAHRLIGLKRLGLAARAVEREHQLPTEPFPRRLAGDETFELGNKIGVSTEREVCVVPLLERRQAELLESRRLVARKRLVGEVGERLSAPQT